MKSLFAVSCAIVMACSLVSAKPAPKPAAPAKPVAATKDAKPDQPTSLVLIHKYAPNWRTVYKTELTITQDTPEGKATIENHYDIVRLVTAVAEGGDISRTTTSENVQMTVNGEKVPQKDDAPVQKAMTVIKRDGTFVSASWEGYGDMNDQAKAIQARKALALQPIFTDKPIVKGLKWKKELKAGLLPGSVAATSEYEVVDTAKQGDIPAVQLKYKYTESGNKPISYQGDMVIEASSGDIIKLDVVITNFPMGGDAVADAKLKWERTDAKLATAADEKKKDKTIEEITKDFKKLDGAMTLYRKTETGNKDTIYLEVPEAKLGKNLLLQCTLSSGAGGGSLVAGYPVDDIMFEMQKLGDDKLVWVVPNLKFRVDPSLPLAKAADRAFPGSYIQSFKIEAKSDERKTLLINISDIFLSDLADITSSTASLNQGAYSIDREKSYIKNLKVFPDNIVAESLINMQKLSKDGPETSSMSGYNSNPLYDPRSIPINICWNLFFLAESNYTPRIADGRVGYFFTQYQDLNRRTDDAMVRYISRWDLKKKDPSAAISEPVKPIVWWLDNAIPSEYRESIASGLKWWNRAFEQVGIKDAIVVNQMPDNADWDYADMRYNIVRWVASPEAAYAISLFRRNPITGEVLNAGICIDANMVRFTGTEFDVMIAGSAVPTDPKLSPMPKQTGNPYGCCYQHDSAFNAWMGSEFSELMMADGATPISRDAYVQQYIRSIVAHEFGHSLGLRHNFIASTNPTMTQLKDIEWLKIHGITSSVMDYTPFNIGALISKNSMYWSDNIGEYDMFAIKYGYSFNDAKNPTDELPYLKAIAAEASKPGLQWQGDEMADNLDPHIVRFDLAKNPIDFYSTMMSICKKTIPKLQTSAILPGQSYYQLTRKFISFLRIYNSQFYSLAGFLGGSHTYRDYKGDMDSKPSLTQVSDLDQRRVVSLITKGCLAADAYDFIPSSIYQKLAPNPFVDIEVATTPAYRWDQPVRDQLSSTQITVLNAMTQPDVLSKISNNAFKQAPKANVFNVMELITTLDNNICTELRAGRNVTELRAMLQQAWFGRLIALASKETTGLTVDSRIICRAKLKEILSALKAINQAPLNAFTKMHILETIDKISKSLNSVKMEL